jgi:alkylhydroperoxidase/carboxymuconolactone decarboxylase family protein YurZ
MDLVSPDRVMQLDPVFGAMGVEAGRKIWSPSLLSAREKAVLLLAGDVAVRELGLPFELHAAMALSKAKMSIEDLREIFRHVAPVAGLNPASRVFERLKAVALKLGQSPESNAVRTSAPHPPAPYPSGVLETLRAADPQLAATIEGQSAELWGRPGLSRRERVLASLAIDIASGTFGQAFAAHVRMALAAGVTRIELHEALRALAEYSTARAWEATIAVERLLRSATDMGDAPAVPGFDRCQPRTVESSVEVLKYERTVLNKPDASGLAIVETRLVERFSGGIIGEGQATHLRLERSDGTGTLICYERINGSIGEHQGSFLLEASGSMGPGTAVHGHWKIVDGSGSGQLENLRGHAEFSAQRDETSPTGWRAGTSLTYWHEPSAAA